MNPLDYALEFIEDNDVRFIRMQFCDLFGNNKNISVSAPEFKRAYNDGIMFRTSAMPGYDQYGETELILYPVPETILNLPWRPHQGSVARVLCRVGLPDGSVFTGDSRQILIDVVENAKKQGLEFEIGAKIEFYLFELEDDKPSLKTVDDAGFFDLAPIDKGEDTRREIILTLEEMGFSITSSHHEIGRGQHQIDFRMSDPLTCADNIQTFKSVVKTIAEQNGLHASFMPKPLNEEPGSGMHIMITVFQDGKNLFTDKDGKLSTLAEYFAGGICRELPAICAFSNPIVNSYKRLAETFSMPNDCCWKPDDENAIVRVPNTPHDVNRLIIRNPDAAANPYLLFALLISAGLEGMQKAIDPKSFTAILPNTLLEALSSAQDSAFISEVLSDTLKKSFLNAKLKEWQDYSKTVHDWEIDRYFNRI